MEDDEDLDVNNQAVAYLIGLLKKDKVSSRRGKGMAPSSEHPSHGPPTKRARTQMDELNNSQLRDPDYQPPPPDFKKVETKPRGRGRGRGGCRGLGRGRGRGRGRGGAATASNETLASSTMNSTAPTPSKGEHWKLDELTALVNGCNHLKPVLKGRFKHATDGTTCKALAWEELKGEHTLIPHLYMVIHKLKKLIH